MNKTFSVKSLKFLKRKYLFQQGIKEQNAGKYHKIVDILNAVVKKDFQIFYLKKNAALT